MTTRKLWTGTIALAFALGGPALASGQEMEPMDRDEDGTGIGLEVNAGYYTFGGDLGTLELGEGTESDFLDEGVGFEAILSYGFANGLGIGVGAGFGSHEVGDDPDGGNGTQDADRSADLTTIFLQPTYRLAAGGPVEPFLGARLGFTSLAFDRDDPFDDIGLDLSGDDSRSGLQLGGLAGVGIWVTDEVGLQGSVAFDYLSYDLEDDDDVDLGDDDAISGGRLGFRGGLKVRFP